MLGLGIDPDIAVLHERTEGCPASIYRKLGVSSRREAVEEARVKKLI